jgi:hypothetical protein
VVFFLGVVFWGGEPGVFVFVCMYVVFCGGGGGEEREGARVGVPGGYPRQHRPLTARGGGA